MDFLCVQFHSTIKLFYNSLYIICYNYDLNQNKLLRLELIAFNAKISNLGNNYKGDVDFL